jgi:hypothetical protein
MAARLFSPDAPAMLASRTVWTEIFESAGITPGAVMQTAVGRVKPGRFADYIGSLSSINELALKHGALRIRHGQVAVGGPLTGAVAITGEFAGMAAHGESWQQRNSDPAFQQAVAALTGPDGPVIPDGGLSILTEIRLDV